MFSQRVEGLRPSPIRSILKVIDRPGMISFAGGLPATDVLPAWSGTVPREMLQYGPSEGDARLRDVVSANLRSLGLDAPADRVLILSGSQQGIDLAAKLFVDPGTTVAVEGLTRGRHRDGDWQAGRPQWGAGRFCNIFEIWDMKIQRLHIYLDPDYAGRDTDRYPWLARELSAAR